MNVCGKRVVANLVEVLERGVVLWHHHEIRSFRVGPHPENVRAVPADKTVPDQPLRGGHRLVPHVIRVKGQRNSKISDFYAARTPVAKFDSPEQHVAFESESLGWLDLRHRLDLLSLGSVDTPLKDATGCICRKVQEET